MAVFPEGSTTNGRQVLQLRTGAFRAGLPVQPVLMRYHWKNNNPAYTGSFLATGLSLMTSWAHSLAPRSRTRRGLPGPRSRATHRRGHRAWPGQGRGLGPRPPRVFFEDVMYVREKRKRDTAAATRDARMRMTSHRYRNSEGTIPY